MLDVLRSTGAERDLDGLVRELAAVLREVAHCDRLALVLHDPARDVMRLHAIAGSHTPSTTVSELAMTETPSGLVWQTQRPMIMSRLEDETRFPVVMRIYRDEGMRSLCVVPLTSPVRRLGALTFASREEDGFAEADVEFLRQLTSHVALAVDNTLHHEAAQRTQRELERERDRFQLLLELNNTLVSNRDPRALFGAIATCVRRVVAHEYTSLSVYDPRRDAFDMWALEFAGEGLIKDHMTVSVEGSPAGMTFTAGKPMCFARAELAALTADVASMLLAEGIESMCCVPLAVHGHRLGTLNVGRL